MRQIRPLLVPLLVFSLLASLLVTSGFGFSSSPNPGRFSAQAEERLDGEHALMLSIAPDASDAALEEIIASHVKDLPGDWSVVVKKLDTGQYAAYEGDKVHVSASLYKVFVLVELMRQVREGTVSLDDTLLITPQAAAFDISIDDLHFDIGSEQPISFLADRMITRSDNTAALTLVNKLGIENINATIEAQGLEHTHLDFNTDNLTTAEDMNKIFERIVQGQAVSRAAGAYMLDLLLGQNLADLIPVGLPQGTPIAHKTGTLEQLMHDSGIVYGPSGPFTITILSSHLDDYPTAYREMPRLSEAIYNYFNQRSFQPARYFPETQAVVGPSFLLYYNTHGGAATLGLPLTAERQESGVVYQYFERARLERPVGSSGPVSLARVGAELATQQDKTFDPATEPAQEDDNTLWFAETNQAITQPFLSYWRDHGGADIFGMPLSGVVDETVGGDGPFPVQYFERARFELHGDEVVLGPVGKELLDRLDAGAR